jgi:hypothetical protein
MGLPWVHIQSAYVREGYVGVQILATAEAPEASDNDGNAGPETSPSPAPKAPEFQL